MEYLIVLGVCIIVLILLATILELNMKKVKAIAENIELNEVTNEFPENIEIAKDILRNLNNEEITIEEDKEGKSSLYIVATNKITIANIRNSFTRIQTIAHECIHSVQNKKVLWFNFIFSNIYIIYTIILLILTIFKVLKPSMIQVSVLLLFGITHYVIRNMLEMDAMIKARYVAKEYLEENKICSKEICNNIILEYDKLNDTGIKVVNYDMVARSIIKVMGYCVICVIYTMF